MKSQTIKRISTFGELWKDVVGYEDRFLISNYGRVFGKASKKILVLGTNKNGYKVLSTRIGGRKGEYKCFRVHRLVAEAFLDNPDNLRQVNHIDGNKINNRVENLEWISNQGNIRHALDIGLITPRKGEELTNSVLTDEDVRFIREHYTPRHPEYGRNALARRFGIAGATITRVHQGKAWRHVEQP
ncbi:NUMOD4 motif-containing HNH endonuclease [uncultured Marinobacter sp.]|uniref:NUMOD4 motif-containing HNH endonuclease n=1 Tax=uncultured Marinobacter sp. TaxID=187379 RepID=UPI0025E45843|nr:NUMOD4 motif-containing HNH endonuclease [uncultured Marinobacter sp.]